MKYGEVLFFCGKMGAGKSTKAKEIAIATNAVLLSEDEWLESLYSGEIQSLDDYIKYSKKIKPLVKNLVQSILSTGKDVVMDFPANTVSQRLWLKEIHSEIEAPHRMLYLDASNEVCLRHIAQRRIDYPERNATDSVEIFEAVTKFFTAPSPEEGFNLVKITVTT